MFCCGYRRKIVGFKRGFFNRRFTYNLVVLLQPMDVTVLYENISSVPNTIPTTEIMMNNLIARKIENVRATIIAE